MKLFPDDAVDTSRILDRIEEIENDYLTYDAEGEDAGLLPEDEWTTDDRTEITRLRGIIETVGEVSARDGVALIHERAFRDYIREGYQDGPELYQYSGQTHRYELIDIYASPPFNHIDWDAVAEDDRSSYTPIEIDGDTYYYLAP